MRVRRLDRGGLRLAAMAVFCLSLSACGLFEKELGIAGEAAAAVPDPRETRIAALETELASAQAQNAQLEKKVSEFERRKAEELGAVQAAAVEPPTLKDEPGSALAAEAAPLMLQPPEIKPETVVAAADADRALASAPAAPVESAPRLVQPTFASQQAVFENEADETIKTTSVLFGVHLASYRHAEEAKAGWVKLQRDYPDALGLLEPRLERVEIEGRGAFLRLIGGGFASEEKAAALCAALKALGAYCAVAGFEGERLSFAEHKSG
ncbi:MAG: SPOR domain-containing protein [Parvularculaceae bacterium]